MYIIVKENDESAIIKTKKALSKYIKCSPKTIYNHLGDKKWTWKEYTIYNPTKIDLNSGRGGLQRGGFGVKG